MAQCSGRSFPKTGRPRAYSRTQPTSADDLPQEAFYRFLRADAVHESEGDRQNSLDRIAANLARDARRRGMTRSVADVAVEGMSGATVNPASKKREAKKKPH